MTEPGADGVEYLVTE